MSKNPIRIIVLAFLVILLFGFSQAFAQERILILDLPGVGKVEADLDRMVLIFTAYNPGKVPMEYSILAGDKYYQSEAGGWAEPEFKPGIKEEPLPHYVTFIVTIGRYEKMAVAICRENDRHLAVVRIPTQY